ncbi:phage tail spike protein [Anaerotignum propionicum]|uniref:Phage minor structural protein, N-terminal region n=1 Tax=Anaerotignum propionicum DSM 1682 TaxID=991789 RepID=A0AA94HZ58_ANAPI|nr:phage tail spike protein [Anaerotignum propionicum]SHE56282.1 phage minor structural protein, N-terminal region [[Clostridium] propionicum DSM 1682] [Anaerotignum propionicum DSM 1682]SHE88979.1 phage minor structural protein, N-terminal region [[Clostridium] propionicum DSM 1682] [Anaerotignum propionicum DSM 1682]
MITIHEKNSTTFDTLGLGALLPSLCTVKEELNGLYELELEHPYDEWGKWEDIEKGRILCVSTPRGKQPFRIYNIKPTMESIAVNARHIFYDLLDNFIQSCGITAQTPQSTLNSLKSSFNYSMPFTFNTTLTGTGSMAVSSINPIAALLGDGKDNDSFVSVFGGEILRDNYNISFLPSIGSDKGVSIRYSKNLIGLVIEEDISEVATKIFPIGKDGLIGSPVSSSHINDYPYPKARKYEDSSLTTQAQLTAFAQSILNSGVDLPTVNIKADFQLLAKTEEYKNFAILEDVQLGDVVTVVNSKMNFSKKAKVISYEWDCLLEKYSTVELGDFVADITSSITSGEKSLSTALGASTEVKQVLNLISGNITIANNTLYISMDNVNYTQATKLFRWGTGGLQFSSTGVNGTWKTIIDSNGNLVT